MSRIWLVLVAVYAICAISCTDHCGSDPADKQSTLDSSFVEINTDHGLLFNTSFHPCDALGYTVTWINHPDTSLYQPIVVMPAPFNWDSDFLFNIYFKNTDIPIDRDPDVNALQVMLSRALQFGFNEEPHVGDIIFYVRQHDKRYANSWDPESVGLASPPYIRDRTGLHVDVHEYEVVQNDCRSSGDFPAIRLILDVAGFLVTSDQADSLWIEGRLDFLMSTSVF